MSLLVRPPGDKFTFRLFFKLAATIKCSKDSIYLWSSKLDPGYAFGSWDSSGNWISETELDYRIRLIDSIKNNVVIIGVKDHLTSGEFNPWHQEIPIIADYLKSLFEYYPDKKFILFTSVENLEAYIDLDNVRIVPWGGDITNQQLDYAKLEPVVDKNFDSNYTFLSLNRNKRSHRAMLVSLLYGLNLEQHGLISCMFKESIDDLFQYTCWPEYNVYNHGFSRFKSSELVLNDDPVIYTNGNNDNVSNFNNKLTPYYQNTFVEIVAETSYTEKCFNLTEKTLNSIYGCNFPIILSSQGTVAFLRNAGMDMFDDIVNHNYDSLENPSDRLYRAVHDNIELLTNNKKTKELWSANCNRFIKNVDFAKNILYNFYNDRAETLFLEAKNDFNL
jgi:hypothetical protein